MSTLKMRTIFDGKERCYLLDDVLHVPDADHGLSSPGKTVKQGFRVQMSPFSMNFIVYYYEHPHFEAEHQEGMWGFSSYRVTNSSIILNLRESTSHKVRTEEPFVEFSLPP